VRDFFPFTASYFRPLTGCRPRGDPLLARRRTSSLIGFDRLAGAGTLLARLYRRGRNMRLAADPMVGLAITGGGTQARRSSIVEHQRGRWLLTLVTAALLAMMSVHLQTIARAADDSRRPLAQIFQTPGSDRQQQSDVFVKHRANGGIFFTAASVWGTMRPPQRLLASVVRTTWHWQRLEVSVTRADDAVELARVFTSRETAFATNAGGSCQTRNRWRA
jgi:hypothetical protein